MQSRFGSKELAAAELWTILGQVARVEDLAVPEGFETTARAGEASRSHPCPDDDLGCGS